MKTGMRVQLAQVWIGDGNDDLIVSDEEPCWKTPTGLLPLLLLPKLKVFSLASLCYLA